MWLPTASDEKGSLKTCQWIFTAIHRRYGLCDLVSIWGDFFKFVTMVKLSFTPVQDPGVKPDTEKEKQDGVPAVFVVPVTVPGDGINTKDAELAVSISQNNPKW